MINLHWLAEPKMTASGGEVFTVLAESNDRKLAMLISAEDGTAPTPKMFAQTDEKSWIRDPRLDQEVNPDFYREHAQDISYACLAATQTVRPTKLLSKEVLIAIYHFFRSICSHRWQHN
jgi:hypothetical protein